MADITLSNVLTYNHATAVYAGLMSSADKIKLDSFGAIVSVPSKTVVGRNSAGSGAPEALTLAGGLSINSGVLGWAGSGTSGQYLAGDGTPKSFSSGLADKLATLASTSGGAGFQLTPGTAPSSPLQGEMWQIANQLYYQGNSGTWQVATTSTWAAVSQAEAEAGTATTSRLWTAQRVRQAIAAYAMPLDASVNAAQLNGQSGSYYLNRANHTGLTPASVITPDSRLLEAKDAGGYAYWGKNVANTNVATATGALVIKTSILRATAGQCPTEIRCKISQSLGASEVRFSGRFRNASSTINPRLHWIGDLLGSGTPESVVQTATSPDGYHCLIIGTTGTAWATASILVDAMVSNLAAGQPDLTTGWSLSFVTDFTGYVDVSAAIAPRSYSLDFGSYFKLNDLPAGATVGADWTSNVSNRPQTLIDFGSLANAPGNLTNDGSGGLSWSAASTDASTLGGQLPSYYAPQTSVDAKDSRPVEVTVATARATVAKIGTTVSGNYVPAYGDRINVTFNDGISASNATLNIDGGGAKNIRVGGVNVSTTLLSTGAGIPFTVPLWYDGTYWQMYGSLLNTYYNAMPLATLQTGTASTTYVCSPLVLTQWADWRLANYPTDAPSDGKYYSRKDGAWAELGDSSGFLTLAGSQDITGLKTFTNGLTVNGGTVDISANAGFSGYTYFGGTTEFAGQSVFSSNNKVAIARLDSGNGFAVRTLTRTVNATSPYGFLDIDNLALNVNRTYKVSAYTTGVATFTGAVALFVGDGTAFTVYKLYEAGTGTDHPNLHLYDSTTPAVKLYAGATNRTVNIQIEEYGNYSRAAAEFALLSSGGGSVTSVDLSMPTGFTVSNNPVTSSGTLTVAFAAGYALPTTTKQTQWDTAYGWGNHASAGYITSTGSISGNAATATKLATARTIGGVSFDGSASINLPGVNAAGNQNTTGSAATLTTARTLTIGSTGKTFNGSANVTWSLAEIGAQAALGYTPLNKAGDTMTGAFHNTATDAQIWFDGGGNTNSTNRHVTIVHNKTTGNIGFYDARVSGWLLQIDSSNMVTALDFTSSSDERDKENWRPVVASTRLQPFLYTRISTGQDEYGFNAQSVEVDYPHLVKTDDTGWKSIRYGKVTAVLAQQLNDTMDELIVTKETVAALSDRLAALEELVKGGV